MSLYFYSDQIIEENKRIDMMLIDEASKLAGGVENIILAYIPSGGDPERNYYNDRVKYYSKLGIKNFFFFDLNDEYDEDGLKKLERCTIIHLSGGKPQILNNNVKRREFGIFMKRFSSEGGILVGVSAGAIQMTKSIGLFVAFQKGFVYEVDNHMESLTTSKLVEFEFIPHFNRFDDEYKSCLKEYASRYSSRIYCCNDGDGVIVRDGSLELVGPITVIN